MNAKTMSSKRILWDVFDVLWDVLKVLWSVLVILSGFWALRMLWNLRW